MSGLLRLLFYRPSCLSSSSSSLRKPPLSFTGFTGKKKCQIIKHASLPVPPSLPPSLSPSLLGMEVHGNVHVLDVPILVEKAADVIHAVVRGRKDRKEGECGKLSRVIDSSSISPEAQRLHQPQAPSHRPPPSPLLLVPLKRTACRKPGCGPARRRASHLGGRHAGLLVCLLHGCAHGFGFDGRGRGPCPGQTYWCWCCWCCCCALVCVGRV